MKLLVTWRVHEDRVLDDEEARAVGHAALAE